MLNKSIREVTQNMHASLEKLMHVDEIMNGNLTYVQYQKMMLTNYLVTSKYEQQLINAISTETALKLDLHKRVKLNTLRKDLSEINIHPQELKKEAFAPNTAFALGCLYVLEGATLGGNIIVNQ